jgi:hypothetical protein
MNANDADRSVRIHLSSRLTTTKALGTSSRMEISMRRGAFASFAFTCGSASRCGFCGHPRFVNHARRTTHASYLEGIRFLAQLLRNAAG